jgi:hypothetical protein
MIFKPGFLPSSAFYPIGQTPHPLNGITAEQANIVDPHGSFGHLWGNYYTSGIWSERCQVCGVERMRAWESYR